MWWVVIVLVVLILMLVVSMYRRGATGPADVIAAIFEVVIDVTTAIF
jgi:hypothetical protein